MPTWIRFRCDNGDSFLANAEQTHMFFKVEPCEIEILPAAPTESFGQRPKALFTFPCEFPEQVHAAEDLVFDALCQGKSITLNLENLEEHADYLSHVHGISMVLSLIHQGFIHIPVNADIPQEDELFLPEEDSEKSEIKQFERILHTYLDVPSDVLRHAWKNRSKTDTQSLFSLNWDYENCPDHGSHEYWNVSTLPDHSYCFRESYNELARDLVRKEGYQWEEIANLERPESAAPSS